jgi:hypothetical protein
MILLILVIQALLLRQFLSDSEIMIHLSYLSNLISFLEILRYLILPFP